MSYKPTEEQIVKRIIDTGIGVEKADAYLTGLNEIARKLRDHFSDELRKLTSGSSGALSKSVEVKLPITDKGFILLADEYYDYQDEGVNQAPGSSKSNRGGGSRFSFKGLRVGSISKKGTLPNAMRKVVSGDESKVYATAVSIKQKGLSPQNYTEQILDDTVLEMLATDINAISEGLFSVSFEKFADDLKRNSKK